MAGQACLIPAIFLSVYIGRMPETDSERSTEEVARRMNVNKGHKAEEPIYVTKNGYGDMVIMSMEIYESTMRQIAMYRDIEISEKQIEAGQIKEARTALRETRTKYGL